MAAILIVDDEANIRRMLGRLLEEGGHQVATAARGEEVVPALEAGEPDVVLLDLALPGASGLDVLRDVRARWPALPVIMMSGRATLSDAVRATRLGAFHFIEKPLTPEAVLLTIESAVQLRRARELSAHLSAQLAAAGELVGSSAPLQQVRDWIERVAPTDARVLITGESGTGKELVAAELHRRSRRAQAPFVTVNSASIPRELVESEMFGHERGAFSGAVAMRRGRFELADGGTLFLDEVGDLGVEAQAKLLRALETGEIERVGGERPVRVDVRVVAATNRDLEADARSGRFRHDLFYRLNVLPVRLPPLRERLEDVPALVAHFLERQHRRTGLEPPRLAHAALGRLARYDWPGNVRELANLCERMAILYPGRPLDAAFVDRLLGGSDREAGTLPFAERLDAFERRLIEEALEQCDGRVSDAARALRTDRANLYRRIRRLGIRR
jgi:two-component system, NtrC family, nitrogen regulation response regulator NtrX